MSRYPLFLLLTSSVLTGCNSSDNDQPTETSTAAPQPAAVTAIEANRLQAGQQSNFTITGNNLSLDTLNIQASNCEQLATIAGGHAQRLMFTCTPSQAGPLNVTITAEHMTEPYQQTFTISAAPKTSIDNLTANQIMYQQNSQFTVKGSGLDQALDIQSEQCHNIQISSNRDADQRQFSCTPASLALSFTLTMDTLAQPITFDLSVPVPQVTFETSAGDFTVELAPEQAPITVDNFLQYVNDAFYDGLIFHRVIDGFMIQGGGFDTNLQARAVRAPIELESDNGLDNDTGTIAMARTNEPDSATSQFFINVADNNFLNYQPDSENDTDNLPDNDGYAVFGEVVSGMQTINQIKTVPVNAHSNAFQHLPVNQVIIQQARQTQ